MAAALARQTQSRKTAWNQVFVDERSIEEYVSINPENLL
jgi:hypothetical protein